MSCKKRKLDVEVDDIDEQKSKKIRTIIFGQSEDFVPEQSDNQNHDESCTNESETTVDGNREGLYKEFRSIGENVESDESIKSIESSFGGSSVTDREHQSQNESIERISSKLCATEMSSKNSTGDGNSDRLSICLKCFSYVFGTHSNVSYCFCEHMCNDSSAQEQNYGEIVEILQRAKSFLQCSVFASTPVSLKSNITAASLSPVNQPDLKGSISSLENFEEEEGAGVKTPEEKLNTSSTSIE